MSTPGQRPRIGRIVHFRDSSGQDQAAIITAVWSDVSVNLVAFGPTGYVSSRWLLNLGEGPLTWHWPEYVPAFDFPDAPESMVAK